MGQKTIVSLKLKKKNNEQQLVDLFFQKPKVPHVVKRDSQLGGR